MAQLSTDLSSNKRFGVKSHIFSKFHIMFGNSASVSCKEPIEVVSYKIGVCKVSPNGKECQTDFQRLSFNGKTSVVLCHPKTGRMHQIRVHLQYLGKISTSYIAVNVFILII